MSPNKSINYTIAGACSEWSTDWTF